LIVRLKGLEENEYLRFLDLSGNAIDKVRQILFIEDLPLLTELDLSFNPIQGRRYFRYQMLYRIPQLRKLDGITIMPEEKVKAENLHGIYLFLFFFINKNLGLDLEDRKAIFKSLLPEEEFVDRRIKTYEDIDPESDSNDEDLKKNMDLMQPDQTSTFKIHL
jgi:protein phosphatase 1 regulatory subunit 7